MVSYVKTTKNKLKDVPLKDGQIIVTTDETSSGGGGGHTIVNSSSLPMAGRSNLQFNGANVTDDENNDTTIVDIPQTTFNGRSGSILPVAGDYTAQDITYGSSTVKDALDNIGSSVVASFNGRNGSVLPVAGDYDDAKVVLSSAMSIGGQTKTNVKEALTALNTSKVETIQIDTKEEWESMTEEKKNDPNKIYLLPWRKSQGGLDEVVDTFNGRSGSVLPMAGDYTAQQVEYDSSSTVKEKIDEELDGINLLDLNLAKTVSTAGTWSGNTYTRNGVTYTISDGTITINGTATGGNAELVLLAGDVITEFLNKYSDSELVIYDGTGASVNNIALAVQYMDSATTKFIVASNWATIPATTTRIFFTVNNGYTANNIVIKPMITESQYAGISFRPFNPRAIHRELDEIEDDIDGINLCDISLTTSSNIGTFSTTTSGFDATAASGVSYPYVRLDASHLKNGQNYILSFDVNSVSGNDLKRITLRNTSNIVTQYVDISGTGKYSMTFEYVTNYRIDIFLGLVSPTTSANSMSISNAMITDAKYAGVPYRPYNQQSIQNQINDIIEDNQVLGAWNLAPNEAVTQVISPVTFTVNSDKTVTVSGTTGASDYKSLNLTDKAYLEAGRTYYLSGCPAGGGSIGAFKYMLQLVTTNNTNPTYLYGQGLDSGDGSGAFAVAESGNYRIRINTYPNQTYSNLVFKPMLALQPNTPYTPWCMTNKELTPVDITSQVTWASGFNKDADYTRVIKVGDELHINIGGKFADTLAANTWGNLCTLPLNICATLFPVVTRTGKVGYGQVLNNNKIVGAVFNNSAVANTDMVVVTAIVKLT